ncbi:hypothetical protein [Spirillospora albida]|uniref:hypothetical protein n=1 Tax=Spirillospora albida TaxID=58123 RepID=UPI00068A4B7A|nr:hypothetical protein [Spirillospora albida]
MPAPIIRADYSVNQLAVHLGLAPWQMRLGREHGLLPEPDRDGERWSAALAAELEGGQVIARFGTEPPIGAGRAATRLAGRVGIDVERPDIAVLAAHGELRVISAFRGHPVYLLRDLDALDPDAVRAVVSTRKGPLADTVDAAGAAAILDWPRRAFDRIALSRSLPMDRLGRYMLADVRALKADELLARQVSEEKHRLAAAKRHRQEAKCEDAIRGWILRCTAYVDRVAEDPPDTAALSRALRTLTAARRTEPG